MHVLLLQLNHKINGIQKLAYCIIVVAAVNGTTT